MYEIYYKHLDEHAEMVLAYLNEFENVISFGRRGLFLQRDMHQAVEMGLAMGSILSQESVDAAAIDRFYRRYVRYLDH